MAVIQGEKKLDHVLVVGVVGIVLDVLADSREDARQELLDLTRTPEHE